LFYDVDMIFPLWNGDLKKKKKKKKKHLGNMGKDYQSQ